MSCLLRRNSQSLEVVPGLRRRRGLLSNGSRIVALSTNSCKRIFLIVLFVAWFPIARSVRVVEDIDPFLNNVPPTLGFSMMGGYLVDKGGDVNGDGIADILVADTTANSNTGVCYVVFGKKDFENTNMDLVPRATGISAGFRVTGAAVGDELGRALSTAGDLNGDGIGDLVISAWKADPPGKTNAGIVYVLFGRKVSASLNNAFVDTQLPTTALATSVGFRILGAATNDQCCNSARNAGDINGDGVHDIVLGSYNVILIAGHVQTGIAYLIFGRKVTVAANNGFSDIQLLTTALPITIGFRIIGAVSGDWFGIPVSSAGDVNGDGVIDIIIGAVLADPPAGSGSGIAYVFYGRNVTSNGVNAFGDIQLPATALASTVGFRILGAVAGDVLGASDGIGDFNGDGVSDVVVGAYGSSGEAGMAYVIYGRKVINAGNAFPDIQLPTTAMPASLGFRIIGAAALDQAGNSVRGAGDVNGDGLKDLIVGAAGANPTANRAGAGIAYVIFGRNVANGAPAFSDILLTTFTASSTVGYRILGVNSNDSYGGIVAGLGDVNGDGAMDIAVGGTGALKAYVIYGTLYSPTSQPSCQPSRQPSSQPSRQPSRQPSSQPILNPTVRPTAQPSQQPSRQPTMQPSRAPSGQPLSQPTAQPTAQPSQQPSRQPSVQPSCKPSTQPTSQPSALPSCRPSSRPSTQPSCTPTTQPTQQPARQPSCQPNSFPTSQPSHQPTHQPSRTPSSQPTCQPTMQPSAQPSHQPFGLPSAQPSAQPSGQPTAEPSSQPSITPSDLPSCQPSAQPTKRPTSQPSCQPSSMPSQQPTGVPTLQPRTSPSRQPSSQPSTQPTCDPTAQPTTQPSVEPSSQPTNEPSAQPSIQPTQQPSNQPSGMPTSQPTNQPSGTPSAMPTTQPSAQPTTLPSVQPSVQPSLSPTQQPSMQPSEQPRTEPTSQPTASPTSAPTADKSTWAVAINAVLGITSIGSIYQDTWTCEGQNRSASCLVINAAGMIVARHIFPCSRQLPCSRQSHMFPWNMVQSTIAIGELSASTMLVSGRTITPENIVNSEVASCELSQARLECTAWTLYSTQFTATSYVPFPKKALYVGSYLDYTSITVMDATTHTIQSYIYSFSNIKSVTLLQVQAPPGYVGGFVAGTSLSVSGAANYIAAGMVRTDTGVLSLVYYAPSGWIIVSSDDLENTMALEYEHPDSFIAGGLLLNDNLGKHAYLLRVNSLFGSVRYGVRYIPVSGDGDRRLLSDSFTFTSSVKGMVRVGNDVYLIVDATRAYSNGTSSTTGLSVIKAEITTGEILQQVHVSSLIASISCSGVTTSSTQLYLTLACRVDRNTVDAESVLISTDLRLSFSKLPARITRQEYELFTAERVAFQRFALPVSTKSTNVITTKYRFSTADGVPTLRPTVSPTLQPTVLKSSPPSGPPSSSPTSTPSVSPQPTSHPSSSGPTNTYKPTVKPTQRPSRAPSKQPTVLPTVKPSITPTKRPSQGPSVFFSTQPSPGSTAAPTLKPTIQPTCRSTTMPTLRPTSSPSTSPSAELIVAGAGYREERLDSPVMILVYVLTGLTGIWCAYKMLNCYQYTLQKRKRSRKMQAELDSIQVCVADQPAHQPHLPSPRTQRASTVTSHGAYAIGTPIGANASTPKMIALQGAVQSDSGSSSVVLSSLHSSEMSDISNSVYSDEQYSEENSSFLQLPQSEESLMEEGGDQHSQGCSINGSSGGSGDDKQSDENFAGSSVVSDNVQKISESSNSDMLS